MKQPTKLSGERSDYRITCDSEKEEIRGLMGGPQYPGMSLRDGHEDLLSGEDHLVLRKKYHELWSEPKAERS